LIVSALTHQARLRHAQPPSGLGCVLPYANEKWQLKNCQKHKKQHASQKPKIKASENQKSSSTNCLFCQAEAQKHLLRNTGSHPKQAAFYIIAFT